MDAKKTDDFSEWLICMFSEISPSILEEEIPERDLELLSEDGASEAESRTHTNWKIVVAVSGFAAACSAAVAGIAVFVCMRHFAPFDSVHHM